MNRSLHCVVVGAGPAGLASAQTLADRGAQVTLIDDNPRPGGQIWRFDPRCAHESGRWMRDHQVDYRQATRVVAVDPQRGLLIQSAHDSVWIRYDRLILCTGARERFLPFPGWTLPGVTGAGGLQALIKGGMPVRGKRVVIAGTGPLLLAVARTAREAGASVVMIAEQTPRRQLLRFTRRLLATPGKLLDALGLRLRLGLIPYRCDSYVIAASGTSALQAVTVRSAGREYSFDCDLLACGYGLVPNTSLAATLGCRTGHNGITVDAVQRTSMPHIYAAGECCGVAGMECARLEGRIAALAATDGHADTVRLIAERERWRRFGRWMESDFDLREALLTLPDADTIVCRCEDVSHAALSLHRDWRSAKLHTRCGMGACQGKVCSPACQILYGWGCEPAPVLHGPVRVDSLIGASMAPPLHEPLER